MRTGSSVKSLHDALLPADLERRRPMPPAPAESVTANHCPGQQKWWAHELSASSLASSDAGYTQQPWLPDEVSARCMLCAKPFHFWRWTHHCRDCGGLYCDACSSHRVEARAAEAPSLSLTTLRLCDTCAFSPSHPRHVGCKAPCACPRCMAPRSAAQLLYYAKAAVLELLAAPFCCFGFVWPYVGESTPTEPTRHALAARPPECRAPRAAYLMHIPAPTADPPRRRGLPISRAQARGAPPPPTRACAARASLPCRVWRTRVRSRRASVSSRPTRAGRPRAAAVAPARREAPRRPAARHAEHRARIHRRSRWFDVWSHFARSHYSLPRILSVGVRTRRRALLHEP